jgi:hypothetical protein
MRRTLFILPLILLGSACATTSAPIPHEWLQVRGTARIQSLTLDRDGGVVYPSSVLLARDGAVRVESSARGQRLVHGETVLTDWFAAIDSFHLSETRGEVVFSAKRDERFDIGLVSSEGSHINWFPSDPADEVMVQWAPRGNKVSYIIRSSGGDVVRTLHVPTSAELTVPFVRGRIQALAWDPQAEHYAVAYSTLLASDQIEVMRYDGSERRTVLRPAEVLDAELEPIGPGAVLLRPGDIRYGETLPLVFWVSGERGWSDALARLIRGSRLAVVVTAQPPAAALWDTVEAIRWVDVSRSFVVAERGGPPSRALLVRGDASVPEGSMRRGERVVSVSPSVVQSFAAGFIAEELKRTTPSNAIRQ